MPTVAMPFRGPATPPLSPRRATLPSPPGHPLGPQAASRPAQATPQPLRRLGAPSSTLVEVESQNRAPAHTGALRDGAAARRASGATPWGRCMVHVELRSRERMWSQNQVKVLIKRESSFYNSSTKVSGQRIFLKFDSVFFASGSVVMLRRLSASIPLLSASFWIGF